MIRSTCRSCGRRAGAPQGWRNRDPHDRREDGGARQCRDRPTPPKLAPPAHRGRARPPYAAAGFPAVPVYDEVFYVLDAIDLLRWGTESGLAVHPPLGKWWIVSGMATFGVEPLGWRMASVLAGVGLVLVAALIGRLVTRRRLWGRCTAGWWRATGS